MVPIPDETSLRLGLQISSKWYLEDGDPHFTEVTKHNHIGFDRKEFEDGDSKEDSKKAIIDLEEETRKKRAWRKAKKDAMWAQTLLLAAVPRLFTLASASVLVLGFSATVPELSALASASILVLGLSATIPELSAIMPGSSLAMSRLSAVVPGLSAAMPGLSAPVFEFIPMPGLSVLPRLSPLLFPTLSLPKIPAPNLAAEWQRLDDTIIGWSGRSKRASSKELFSGRVIKAALEEIILPGALLFLLFFPSNGIGKRKLDKNIINTWLLADNHVEKEVDLCFAICGYPAAVQLNKSWQIEFLEWRLTYIVKTIPLAATTFWDPNFMPCPHHTLNLTTKLGLKTKNLPNIPVKKRI